MYRRRSLVAFAVALCLIAACAKQRMKPRVEPRDQPTHPAAATKAEAARTSAEADPDATVELEVQPSPTEVGHVAVRPLLSEPTPPVQTTAEAVDLGPLILRVGLATDMAVINLPCCEPRTSVGSDGFRQPLTRVMKVQPGAGIRQTALYRLQAAALKDEGQAQSMAERLGRDTGWDADAVFDADLDLYRVRVGRWALRDEAESARGRLTALGVDGSWVVTEGGNLLEPSISLSSADQQWSIDGRWLDIATEHDAGQQRGIEFDGTRYRGKLLVFLNDRGLLNVVNELTLEEYLRGVVPMEMGPELYNQLEALKAQTVAARTYTLRNLGEFAGEGYDICSTPRCQVYGGMAVEHRRTDRAIAATEGLVVLYDGEPAETFYSATCGGHTENVEVIFPLKRGDYLRGVPCVEAGTTRLASTAGGRGGEPFISALMHRLLPSPSEDQGSSAKTLASRIEQLGRLAGLPAPADQLRSTDVGEVVRYIASEFDVALDRRLITDGAALDGLLANPPADWRRRELRLAAHLRDSELTSPARRQDALSDEERERLLLELALYLGVLDEQVGHFQQLVDRQLGVRFGKQRPTLELPTEAILGQRRGDQVVTSNLDLMAGDRVVVYRHHDAIHGLLQPIDAPAVDLSRHAPRRKWRVFKTDAQLRASVQARYPGFPFVDFEVLERGVSGRVGKLALIGSNGRRVVVEGLAVRWTLDIYDTLFWAERHQPKSGKSGWTFRGRGWGHGVGMSQAGAYGMAVRGATYREILEHYYSGIALGRLKPSPPRPRTPVG